MNLRPASPSKAPKAEEPTPARSPLSCAALRFTADLGPVQPAQQASFDSHATRLDIPVASPNTGANLGRTMVIETDALREELARDRAEAEDRAARRERLRKFASLTALPDEEDMPEEDEESFMSLGALRRAKQAEKQAKKAAKVMGDASPAIGIKTAETPPIDEEAAPVVEEFSSLGDAAIIERDLAGLWGALLFRLIVSLAGFGGILYLSLMSLLPKALPGSTLLTDTPVLYMGMMTGMLALLCLVSNKVVGGGLMALFRLKATNDTPLALSALASLGRGRRSPPGRGASRWAIRPFTLPAWPPVLCLTPWASSLWWPASAKTLPLLVRRRSAVWCRWTRPPEDAWADAAPCSRCGPSWPAAFLPYPTRTIWPKR